MAEDIAVDELSESRIRARAVGFLARDRFDALLSALRGAGIQYDAERRANIGPAANLLPLVTELLSHGFRPSLAPQLAARLTAEQEQAQAARADLDARFAATEERLGRAGITLRQYQRSGVRWLLSRPAGSLLADDMGLGKTVQALAAADPARGVLVVAPAAVTGSWRREIVKFRPDLRVRVHRGRKEFAWPWPGEALIVTYDSLTAPPAPSIAPTLILDELHAAKGQKTKRSKAVHDLSQRILSYGAPVYGLTGTPLVNRPQELWTLLEILGLGTEGYGCRAQFWRDFGIRRDGTVGAISASAPIKLRRVMLHRRKADVLTELPAKEYAELPIAVDGALAAELERVARACGIDFSVPLGEDDLRQLLANDEMFRLRKQLAELAIPRVLAEVEAYEEADEPLVVFSAHRAPIDVLAGRPGWAAITGDTAPEKRAQIVERFQAGLLKGLALTIRAGGVGITLTRASHAVFADSDWTPAGNAQAEDRLHRIGQSNAVLIKRVMPDHPLVERVEELLAEKRWIIANSVSASAVQEHQDTTTVDRLAAVDLSALTRPTAPPEAKPDQDAWEWARAVPGGSYALVRDGKTVFYEFGRPDIGKWAGWGFFALVIGDETRRLATIRPNGSTTGVGLDSLREIAANPKEASARYGREIGQCGVCGKTLTNEESRTLGIGPVCIATFGLG